MKQMSKYQLLDVYYLHVRFKKQNILRCINDFPTISCWMDNKKFLVHELRCSVC